MLGALLAVVVVAAPEPGSAGAVEGPFAWVDLHGALDTERAEALTPVMSLPFFRSRGLSAAAQVQLLGGWGLALAGQRLDLTAALQATLLPAPFNLGAVTPGQALFQLSPLRLGVSAPLALGPVVLLPRLAFDLPTVGFIGTSPPPLTLTPRVDVRGRVGDFLLGAGASFGFLLAPPSGNTQRRCDDDAAACRQFREERWRARLVLQAEYFVLDSLSLGARLEGSVRDEYTAALVGASTSPSAPVVADPGVRTLELRPGASLTWTLTAQLGLTLDLSVATSHVTATPPDLAPGPWSLFAAQVGLSLWFRTDPQLQRAWLER